MEAFMFDPLKLVNEIVIIGAVTAALVVAWINRARVLQALTGDDRIHADCLDFLWFTCCQGCGLCTGEWTRCLTKWPCCPKRVRGANLVNTLGQCFGLMPYTVELKNIVCGDLPYDSAHGDFFLVVENAANPPMMSSLAEEKHPKVVHFPETITVRLRWSHLEEPLRISVRELNILGSQDLCQCRIDALHILDWSEHPQERIKRFEMKPIDHNQILETPPWILLEFDTPSEVRDLDHFHGSINVVRTATRDGHYNDTPLDRFKREYVLLDANGHAMDEVPEEDLQDMERLQSVSSSGYWFCNFVTVAFVLGFVTMRAYVSSCHREYVWLTMAFLKHEQFPIGVHKLRKTVEQCQLLVERDGAELGTPCRPNSTHVMGLCKSDPSGGHFPKGQARPAAFSHFVSERFGLTAGVPCLEGVCIYHDNLVKLDFVCVAVCVALVLMNCFFHLCMRHLMHARKRNKQHRRLEQSKLVQEQVLQQNRSSYSFF